MKKLPVYKLTIKDNDEIGGLEAVALVDNPAIERNWHAFNEHKDYSFKVVDEERRIITGPLMVADLPIYRRTKEGLEFYVVFDKQTIEQIAMKAFRTGTINNVNLMHDNSQQPQGVYLFESMLVDKQRGVSVPAVLGSITEGSWIGSYKVDNEEIWQRAKTGEFRGFSIEGNFIENLVSMTDQDTLDRIIEILNKVKMAHN